MRYALRTFGLRAPVHSEPVIFLVRRTRTPTLGSGQKMPYHTRSRSRWMAACWAPVGSDSSSLQVRASSRFLIYGPGDMRKWSETPW